MPSQVIEYPTLTLTLSIALALALALTLNLALALTPNPNPKTRGRQAAPGASLDTIVLGTDGLARLDSVRSTALGPAASVSARMRRDEVLAYLDQLLTPREAVVVRERFGLGESGDSQTLNSIARSLGVSQTRVRQIEAR